MEIQDEATLPMTVLDRLEDDYTHAVLHLAWDRHSETGARTLLFAFVELLPAEIPPPLDDYDPKASRSGFRLGGGSEHHVYVRHAVLTAQEAIEWYSTCRGGSATLPGPAAKPLVLADLGEHPRWPALIAASEDTDVLPFAPQWIHCPRTHHLVPLAAFDLDRLWSGNEQEAARRGLKELLHFDLADYPEYWGSVHLVAPNPVYREVVRRLQPRMPPTESVLIRFQPREGKSVAGLGLTFVEKDAWGATASVQVQVRDPLLRLNFDREVHATMVEVWDPHRGFLQFEGNAHVFLRSIHTDVRLARRTIVVGGDAPYEVTRTGEAQRLTAGVRKSAPARTRMVSAYYERKKRRAASAQGQRWFRDQRGDARDLLRSLLNEADRDVLIVDPYFGAAETINFIPAIGQDSVPVRILSSAEVLRTRVNSGPHHEGGDELFDVLRQLQAHDGLSSIQVRVMRGERPAVHDRFLAIDKRIWLLGSSLNEFGSRGTMMVALPDPDAVREDLEKAWREAEPLEAWVLQRRRDRQHSGAAL